MITVYLKPNREKPVKMGNPWIFNGAVDKVEDPGESGEICRVLTSKGEQLGIGYYNSISAICVRMLTRGRVAFDEHELERRIVHAIRNRERILEKEKTDSCRLINSEGDFLPGLIVDKFAQGIGIQILTAGMERFRGPIIEILQKILNPQFIFERSDTEARKREGLEERSGLITGESPEQLVILENGFKFVVDLAQGQKTGFFFDQRQNRALLMQYAAGRTVCDCFSYSGGFTIAALMSGAMYVDSVDSSLGALHWVKDNVELNGLAGRQKCIEADVFNYLREMTATYDCIVLDPPKFARHPGEVERASRGYKDINLNAFKRIAPNGIVFTFSCSNAVDPYLFRQIVFAAAADSGRSVQLLHVLSAGPDHPTNIAHKEGEYLKGLVVRVVG